MYRRVWTCGRELAGIGWRSRSCRDRDLNQPCVGAPWRLQSVCPERERETRRGMRASSASCASSASPAVSLGSQDYRVFRVLSAQVSGAGALRQPSRMQDELKRILKPSRMHNASRSGPDSVLAAGIGMCSRACPVPCGLCCYSRLLTGSWTEPSSAKCISNAHLAVLVLLYRSLNPTFRLAAHLAVFVRVLSRLRAQEPGTRARPGRKPGAAEAGSLWRLSGQGKGFQGL